MCDSEERIVTVFGLDDKRACHVSVLIVALNPILSEKRAKKGVLRISVESFAMRGRDYTGHRAGQRAAKEPAVLPASYSLVVADG